MWGKELLLESNSRVRDEAQKYFGSRATQDNKSGKQEESDATDDSGGEGLLQ